jgi:hypothetical protein
MSKNLILILFLINLIIPAIAQEGYDGIKLQGQFFNSHAGETSIDFDVFIISLNGDTLRQERHNSIPLYDQTSFNFTLGYGNFIQGLIPSFSDLDWLDVSNVKINYSNLNNSYEIASFSIYTTPYAFHSKRNLTIPYLLDLIDTPNNLNATNTLLKFDGVNFIEGIDELGDTTLFTWYTYNSNYVDTALTAYNDFFTDSSSFTYLSDSTSYSISNGNVIYADSTIYVDTVPTISYSINNWSLEGNSGTTNNYFIGSADAFEFELKTNNNNHLTFGNNNNIYNLSPGLGLNLDTPDGVLFNLNNGNELNSIPHSHLYFNGNRSSLHGGGAILGLDSLIGNHSFSWGEDVGTNGNYSTIFGKNTYGDSTSLGATDYAAISSFAVGKNCRTTYMGVAIGDSAIAGYYRNVAIGKNVIANTNSASLAIGNNVLSTGATSWAAGNNVAATGHFSTVLGTNSNSNNYLGGFVYGDFSTPDTVYSSGTNQFVVRADNGLIFYSTSNISMGVELLSGAGSWNMISDKNKKHNINLIKHISYRDYFYNLPIYSWTYKNEKLTHIGPMAQDLNSIFKVGELPNYINMIDIDGITLLGIKMLYESIEEETKTIEILKLEEEINQEREALEKVEIKINKLYENMDH